MWDSDIRKDQRNFVIHEQLKNFSKHKLIITDRLHGLIFSLITNTPCIVMSSYNYKLNEYVDMLKGNKFISFIDKDLNKLDSEIKRMLKIDSSNYKNNFEEMLKTTADIIKGNNHND